MGLRQLWHQLTTLPDERAGYTPTQVADLWDEACAARGLVRKVGIGQTRREEWPSLGEPEIVTDGLYIFPVVCPMGGQVLDIAAVATGLAEDLEATHAEVLADNGMGARRGRLLVDLRARPTGPLMWRPTRPDAGYIWLGQTMTGKDVVAPVPGAENDCPHLLIAGATGAGKSSLMTIMLAGFMARGDVRLFVVDPGEVDVARWLDASADLGDRQVFEGCAIGSDDPTPVLRAVVEAAEGSRRWIRAHRRSSLFQCHDIPGRPASIVLFLDELHRVLSRPAATKLVWKIVKEHRKDGVMVVASTQTTGHRSVDTEIRANFGARSCGFLAQRSDVEVVMGSFTDQTPAHLLPTNSGQAFVVSPDIGRPVRVQYAWLPDEQIPGIVEQFAPRRAMPPPPEGGGREGGETGTTPPFRPLDTPAPHPPPVDPPPPSREPAQGATSDEFMSIMEAGGFGDFDEALRAAQGSRDEPIAHGRVRRPGHRLARKKDGTVAVGALEFYERSGGADVVCGCGRPLDWDDRGARQVIVVHLDGDRTNIAPTNLEPMCRSCAGKHNGRRAA